MSTFKDSSRKEWTSNDTVEHIQTGALQRIADATELMAKRYNEILNERDLYKRWYEEKSRSNESLLNQLRAYKGCVTRMKQKIIQLQSKH